MKNEKSYFADTSFLIDLIRENEEAVEIAENCNNIVTSSICVFELGRKVDFDLGNVTEKAIIDFRPKDAEKAYQLYRKGIEKGENINNIDYLLAAQAINLEKTILTGDKDYKKVEGLDTFYYRD